jgi:hypothetical protein
MAVEDDFSVWLRGEFLGMDDALGREVPGIFCGIGHVITVRQKNTRQPTHGLELSHQMGQELRAIDEPVAVAMLYDVAVATV